MNELTHIEDRFRAINPVPDEINPPMPTTSTAAALLALEERKVGMQQLTRPKDKETRQRSTATRWLVAAAALVVVMLAIAAGAMLEDSELEPADRPVATSAVPTTTAAPPTTAVDPALEAEALEVAQAYAEARSVDEKMVLVAEGAVFVDGNSEFSGRDEIRGWLEAMDEAGLIVVGSDFRVSGTGVTYHSLTRLHDGEGIISGGVVTMTTVVIKDGLIQSLRRR